MCYFWAPESGHFEVDQSCICLKVVERVSTLDSPLEPCVVGGHNHAYIMPILNCPVKSVLQGAMHPTLER